MRRTALIVIAICCAPLIVHAQVAPLTADEAVQRALSRGVLRASLRGAVEVARGEARTLGAQTNPQLSYVREQTFGPLGTGEDYLSLSQVIDLGNRRGLRREAAERRADALEREGASTRVEVAAEVRLRFYEALYREARAAALRAWIARLDEAMTVVARRAHRGDAAFYDQRRLARERLVAAARSEGETAFGERARARLAALIGATDSLGERPLAGPLMPADEPSPLPSLRARLARTPRLMALDERLRASSLEQQSAGRWWVPELRLDLGWKGVEMPGQGRTDGFLAGVTLSLPLWDRSAGLRLAAQGEALALGGRRGLLESELSGELHGLYAEATRLARTARQFREDAGAVSVELVRIATVGYQGGEMTLLELLDAYRGAGDDEIAALELEHSARRARIDLDRVTAMETP